MEPHDPGVLSNSLRMGVYISQATGNYFLAFEELNSYGFTPGNSHSVIKIYKHYVRICKNLFNSVKVKYRHIYVIASMIITMYNMIS